MALTPSEAAFINKYHLKPDPPERRTTDHDIYAGLTPKEKAFFIKAGINPEEAEVKDIPTASRGQLGRAAIQAISSPTEQRLHDVYAGLVNPWINALNLIPHLNIHQIQRYHPGSLPSVLGEIEGGILPFATGEGAVAAGAGMLPKIAEGVGIGGRLGKGAEKIADLFSKPSALRSAGAGALAGASTTPTGMRGPAALGAGVLAGATHGLGSAVSDIVHKIPTGARVQKAVSLYKVPISDNPNEAVENATKQIAHNYAEDLNEARANYANVLGDADNQVAFGPNDFPNYTKKYREFENIKALPAGVTRPGDISANLGAKVGMGAVARTPEEEEANLKAWMEGKPDLSPLPDLSLVRPSEVHAMKSRLLRQGFQSKARGDYTESNKQMQLAGALGEDLLKKLGERKWRIPGEEGKEEDFMPLQEGYLRAQRYFKDHIMPYRNHAAFKKMVNALEPARTEDDVSKGLFSLNWHGKRPESVIPNLVPTSKDAGTELLRNFQNDLMRGNKEKTAELARNLMFSKYASPFYGNLEKGEIALNGHKFNIKDFLDHYKKLSQSQINYLFTPEDKHVLNTLAPYSKKLKEPHAITQVAKKALGASLGYLTGAHVGGGSHVAKGLGEIAGAALAEPVERRANKTAQMLMSNELDKLLAGIGRPVVADRFTRLPASLGVGLTQAALGGAGYNE